jgi:ABC-type antimicrobial peptide transport system permease subunit
MARRILAWVLLAGFVLLLVNVMFFRLYWQLSIAIYIIVMIGYVLYSSRARRLENLERIRKMKDGGSDPEDSPQ